METDREVHDMETERCATAVIMVHARLEDRTAIDQSTKQKSCVKPSAAAT